MRTDTTTVVTTTVAGTARFLAIGAHGEIVTNLLQPEM
jgi:hypothetical protein